MKTHPFEDTFEPMSVKGEYLELNLCNCVGPQPGETKCPCQLKDEKKVKKTGRSGG